MKVTRLLACLWAAAATGCLWLFPIQKKGADSTAESDAGVTSVTGVDASADGGEPRCISNADCADNAICQAATGKCLQLPTEDCLVVGGKWDDPNAFIFGAYATEPVGAAAKSPAIYNYELALDELNANGGLPDVKGVRHPLAAIICNNDPSVAASDPGFYHRTLIHLVDEIGVKAIVADLAPDALIDAFHQTQKEGKKVFFLSPGAANNELVTLNDQGLVWTMLGPPKDLAPGYADLLRRIETLIHKSIEPAATLRVATVLNDDATEADHELLTELYQAILPKLSFNGASATSQLDQNYRELHLGAGDAGTASAIGDAIVAFAPHVVISMTGTPFTSQKDGVMLEAITKVGGGPGRGLWTDHTYPFFIGSPINAAATNDYFGILLSHTAYLYPVLSNRLLGIEIAGADDRGLYTDYVKRLRAAHADAVEGFENYYDAIYYLAYSVYVAGVEKPLDGANISSGMGRMSSGTTFDVGPGDIEAIFQALKSRDVSIKLIGTGGSLFDVPSGTRIDKAGLYCFENLNGATLAHSPAEIFDADASMWKAFFQCTPGL